MVEQNMLGKWDSHGGLDDIRAGVRAITRRYSDSYWRDCDEGHRFPAEFFSDMAAAGWVGMALPQEYGGGGQGLTAAAAMMEEVAASGAGLNGASSIHGNVFGVQPIVKFGSEDLKRRYLPRVASGDLHVAFGVTEPDAGTETTRIATRAVRVNGGYEVHGRKVWTSKALESEKVLLLVRTSPRDQVARPGDGLTLLMADLQTDRVSISPIPKAGRNAVASCEVTYDGLFVEAADLVGEEGKGFYHLLAGLNAERILVAAGAIGLGRHALERAVQYAKARVVFSRPIGQNQGIAFPLAELHARLTAASLLVYKAAQLYDQDRPCGNEATMAKYLAADACYAATDQAVQTHGGYGYAKEFDVERYWRDARVTKLAPLSQELALNHIAVHGLGLPRSF